MKGSKTKNWQLLPPATITVNPRGTLTLPKSLRRSLGLEHGGVLMAAPAPDGSVVLKATVAFPIEIYTQERLAEFDQADAALGRHLTAKTRRGAR